MDQLQQQTTHLGLCALLAMNVSGNRKSCTHVNFCGFFRGFGFFHVKKRVDDQIFEVLRSLWFL
jgi:hypothetical protein